MAWHGMWLGRVAAPWGLTPQGCAAAGRGKDEEKNNIIFGGGTQPSHILGWYSRTCSAKPIRLGFPGGRDCSHPTPQPLRDHPLTRNTIPTRVFHMKYPELGTVGLRKGHIWLLPSPVTLQVTQTPPHRWHTGRSHCSVSTSPIPSPFQHNSLPPALFHPSWVLLPSQGKGRVGPSPGQAQLTRGTGPRLSHVNGTL